MIRNVKEHTNALSAIYLLIYLFFTPQIFLVIYNALFYILYLVMYFIDIILIFILHTKSSCYLFVSSNIYVHFLAWCFCSSLHENIVILQYITR